MTVIAILNWLGVKPSYSRLRVSDDNAYAESLFRITKCRPEFPTKVFADLDEARAWAASFVHWCNVEHRHSGICYVSPNQRYAGHHHRILAARNGFYTLDCEINQAPLSMIQETTNLTRATSPPSLGIRSACVRTAKC